MSFFEFWSNRTHQTPQLNLNASQRKRLLSDHEARAALQNERMVSLLPPVGTEVFRRLTPDSLKEKKEEENHHRSKPANHLQAGKTLPFIYGDTPPELLNTPLEDLDPFYQSKETFIVLSKENTIYRFNAESACYLLSPFSRSRTTGIKILIHPMFRLFLMLTLLTNCVFMLIKLPEIRMTAEYVFLSVYIFEFILKLLCRGFCVGRFTVIRDPWNWLDIIIITTSLAAEFVYMRQLYALGMIPRVMKIFACSPGLKKTVEALVQSAKRLASVIVLTTFCLFIMAMLALQLFMGSLKHKCVLGAPLNLSSLIYFDDNGIKSFLDYSKYINDPENQYHLPGHLDPLVCGNASDAGVCPEGTTCIKTSTNPHYGYTSYDNFGWTLLSMFRLLTQDFWDNLLVLTMRAEGKHNIVLFVLVFLPLCFILLGFIVAVVAMAQVEREKTEASEDRRREEEFSRIVEVLRRREDREGEESRRAGLSEEQDSPQTQGPEDGEEGRQPSCCSFADAVLKGDCCGCCRWLKRQLRPFVLSPFFDLGIAICIVLNIAFMAAEHYPMSDETEEVLAVSHLVFTAIFTVEMLLKLVALGLHGYFKERRNIFDFVLVVLGVLELMLVDVEGLNALRIVRLLRGLRLERWWPDLHLLIKTVWASVGNLGLVLVFTVFMFTVVGTQMFGRDYKECVCKISADCELPRWHMNDFFHSFLLVVRVLAGQWIECLWDCMQVSSPGMCVVFFMNVLIIGRLLILSLFLNLLLSSFCNAKLATPSGKGTNNLQILGNRTRTWMREQIQTLWGGEPDADPEPKDADPKTDDRKDYLALTLVAHDDPTKEPREAAPGGAADPDVIFRMPEKEKKEGTVPDAENQTQDTPEDCCCDRCYRCCTVLDVDTSLGAGKVWSTFRRACFCIVQHKVFEIVFIVIILLSSAVLVFEDMYLEYRPNLQMFLDRVDIVFVCVFLTEMLLKWIAFGFKAYFSNFWCWLDFLILDVSLIRLTANMMGYSTQPLRVLKALRTLRAPGRFKSMKVVLRAMFLNMPSMLRALLVSLFVWLLFSICGTNLFAGKFFYCFNETSEEYFLHDDVANKTDCFELMMWNYTEVRWKNVKFHFDNVGMGFLSLLITATSCGVMDLLYAAVDSIQVESQPMYEANVYSSLYFVFFGIIGCFFTWNFFIRVFIDSLHQHRNQLGGKHVFMTEKQQRFSRAMMKKFLRKPEQAAPRPQSCCPARLFDLVTWPWFEVFMVVVICMDLLLLMVEADGQIWKIDEIMFWFHFAIFLVFFIEFILKIIALRQHYFRSLLNILDFVALVKFIVGIFIFDVLAKYFINPYMSSVFRLGRVIRALRYIRFARGIRKLLLGFMMSLPALWNIGLLFLLILFTYSYIGMCSFAHVKQEATIDDFINFETFGNSMVAMLLVSTSSSWDGFLFPMMNRPPDCDPDVDCGSPKAGIVFFSSYILLYILLMVHVFIAIILESFNSSDLEGGELLSDKHLHMFYKTWRKFDPDASRVIQYSKLSSFCDALKDPLKIPKPNSIKVILMDVPLLPGDQVHCVDVLNAVMEQVFGESEQKDALGARLEEKFTFDKPSKVSREPISSSLRRKQEEVAAGVIQRAFRKHHQQNPDEPPVGGASGVSDSSAQ